MLASDFRSVAQLNFLPKNSFYVTVNGKIVNWETLKEGTQYELHLRIRGGKGGFGSLLRSFRIHRSTNQLMCRDLSGRRLADIKEEERLRKWIEKAGEREEEKRRQRQEKYEKLKAGPPKHDFDDPKFIETREKILDETDEAFEAGIAAVKDQKSCSNPKQGCDSIEDDSVFVKDDTVLIRKRKRSEDFGDCKKSKLCEEECKPPISTDDLIGKNSVAVETKNQNQKTTATPIAEQCVPVVKNVTKSTEGFGQINLEDYDSAESLQALGLDQLKRALQVRGLKCGGSLVERAERLYSVKGLKEEQYPKNICAGKNGSKKSF